jgi:hypothetical protein
VLFNVKLICTIPDSYLEKAIEVLCACAKKKNQVDDAKDSKIENELKNQEKLFTRTPMQTDLSPNKQSSNVNNNNKNLIDVSD